MRPDDLGAEVARDVIRQLPQIEPGMIDDLICGCGFPSGEHGFNLARAISILAGLDTPGTTVNRYCASSLQSMRMAAHAIRAGEGDVFLCVGVECVSRYGSWTSDPADAQNPRLAKGGDGVEYYVSMGETAENVRRRENVSRAEMDLFSKQSQDAAIRAQDSGFFAGEIVPVRLPDGQLFEVDDGPRRGTSLETLAALPAAFLNGGEVTAGNACPLNDGAAAVIVVSARRARELKITPLARIIATGLTALEPEYMGLGPVEASRQALRRARLTIDDMDIVEINEAFAAQVIPSARAIGVDPFDRDKLNPHGGAIALGHPYGMTGARILCTLLNGLQMSDSTHGLETMCVGGGQGMAMIVERLA